MPFKFNPFTDKLDIVDVSNAPTILEQFNVQTGTSPVVAAANTITFNGATVAAGTHPVRTDGTGAATMALEVQISQAIASTDATKIGLSNFDSSKFTVDANGFVSTSGTGIGQTITGNSGGTLSPTAGNWNIVGTGSITTSGAVSTLTAQLTGITNHSVQVGAGTSTLTQLAVGTNGQVLIGATGADPAFATLTSSDNSITFTTGANSLSLQVTGGTTVGKTITGNTGGALSPTAGNWNIVGTGSITTSGSGSTLTTQLTGLTNHSLLVGAGTATITNLGVATNGQLPIGSTGADPVLATLTAGTGVSITNGAGSITIASTGGGLTWNDVTGTSASMAINNGYLADNASLVTLTLPSTAAQFSVIAVAGNGAGGWTIAQNAGQTIHLGSSATTVGATGSLSSTNRYDVVYLLCTVANTTFSVTNAIGNITVA